MTFSDLPIRVAANVAFQTVGKGIFLITPDNSLHEAKGPVAQELWTILSDEGPVRPSVLCQRIVEAFDVDDEVALAEILQFVAHAKQLGLLEEISPTA